MHFRDKSVCSGPSTVGRSRPIFVSRPCSEHEAPSARWDKSVARADIFPIKEKIHVRLAIFTARVPFNGIIVVVVPIDKWCPQRSFGAKVQVPRSDPIVIGKKVRVQVRSVELARAATPVPQSPEHEAGISQSISWLSREIHPVTFATN